MQINLLYLTAALLLGKYTIQLIIDLRQYYKYKQIDRPQNLPKQISQESFQFSQKYNQEKLVFSMITDSYHIIIQCLFLFSGLLAYIWQYSCNLAKNTQFVQSQNDIPRALIFFFILTIKSQIQEIPQSYYKTFNIQAKYNFNKTTRSLFVKDLFKSFIIKIIMVSILLSGILYIIDQGGESFIFYLFFFILLIIFFFLTIYPNIIQPLFNKFQQLQEGELREKIYKLAQSLKFPLTKIYVCDASKRSSHSNAYLYGMWWNKRIVLFDTLKEQTTDDEIVAIVAHQLGHWKNGHTIQGIAMTMGHLMLFFLAFQQITNNSEILRSFGFQTVMSNGKASAFLGLLVFQYFYTPFSFIIQILFNFCSRRFEYQADDFAKKKGYANNLISGLISLFVKNAGNLNPDSLYSAVHNSHPTLVERIRVLRKEDEKLK